MNFTNLELLESETQSVASVELDLGQAGRAAGFDASCELKRLESQLFWQKCAPIVGLHYDTHIAQYFFQPIYY